MKAISITFALPVALKMRLKVIASATGQTVAEVAIAAFEDYIQAREQEIGTHPHLAQLENALTLSASKGSS